MQRRQATHRLSRGYGGDIPCLVYTDTGPLDLTGQALVANLQPYGRYRRPHQATVVQTTPGTLTVSVPETLIHSTLREPLYRLDITTNGVLVYEALVEIV